MFKNTKWAAVAAMCGLAVGLIGARPAHATPNLAQYAFDLDTTADHRDAVNYGWSTGYFQFAYYMLKHPYRLYIDSQKPDGSFAGRLITTSTNASQSVTGTISQMLGQWDGGSIAWDTPGGVTHYEGTLLVEKSGAVFLTGWYRSSAGRGGILWINGPYPFCAEGARIPDPPR